ncbi:MAG TPA: hypothetical protein VFJ05_03655 [Nitrososphaeraceae archaeon]|nr:hypothetical protein [Nitrososphaeraceae archaeon]
MPYVQKKAFGCINRIYGISVILSTEEIVSRYGGENVKEAIKLQHLVEDYVLFIQDKIISKKITASVKL